jgi:hypothetical protein
MDPQKLFGTPDDRKDFGRMRIQTSEEGFDRFDERAD